jgi:Tfp pilus assembly protein PilO
MSSMAKIFVVVNLVLAVMTFGSAATLLGAQDDYKTAFIKTSELFDTYKTQKTGEIEGLRDQNAQMATKVSTEVAARNAADQKSATLTKDLASTKAANDALRGTTETLTKELTQLRGVVDNMRQALDKQTEVATSQTNDATNARKTLEEEVATRVRLDQDLVRANEQIQEQAAQIGDLSSQLRQANFWVNTYRERFGDITGGPQGSDGRILEVRGNILALSVGSEDGVRVGDIYNLRRGAEYVGQCKVTKVYKGQSVAEFDAEYPGNAAPPQTGDVAYPHR